MNCQRNRFCHGLLGLGLLGLAPVALAANLVSNGGFETGNFNAWTTNADPTSVVTGSAAFTGTEGAEFSETIFMGDEGSEDQMTQTLATQAGTNYVLSFWVNGLRQSSFSASWNGGTLTSGSIFYPGFSQLNSGWTNFQFVVTAASTSTALKFSFLASPGANGSTSLTAIDDISVAALPFRATNQLAGASGVRLTLTGNADVKYAVDRTFNLLPPVGWAPQLTNSANDSGFFIATNAPVTTTNNFWRIRSVY